jgi:glutaredoxin
MFILIIDQELYAHELMYHIMSCDHCPRLKEFLDQLNLLYI